MTKFKVGDRVRVASSKEGLEYIGCNLVSSMLGYEGVITYIDGIHVRVDEKACVPINSLSLVSGLSTTETASVRFILQYGLDQDPFETFATMKEVEARIKELAKRADLKRESIKVYEVAKTYDVKLETRVIFGGTKVKLEERATPAPKKRGRPVGSKNRKSTARSKAMKAAWARRKALAA